MHFSLVIILGIVVFAVQVVLCVKTKRTLIRLIPAIVISAGIALCGIIYVAAGNLYGASFAAVIEALVLAILLAVDGAAWFAYCVARFIQKIRN